MNKKQRQKDVQDAVEKALKHEENLQHDENDEPITFVDEQQAESLEHEDDVLHDENKEHVIFTDES